MSLLVTSEIWGLFVNRLTANDTYFLRNRETLPQAIQMQLSKKEKSFSEFFASFFKFPLNFKHFEKKDDPHRLCVSDIRNCERSGC